jgi:hypothetical protein
VVFRFWGGWGLYDTVMVQFTHDPIVRRLRWVMLAAMLFSMINTLAGQPGSYWHQPETAIRGDGMSIANSINPTFDFFLGHGWLAYLAASVVYLAAAFILVSILPRMMALIAAFAVLFGHFFGAANWLGVRWHLGMPGFAIYGALLGAALAAAAFSEVNAAALAVKRLRWVMLAAIILDYAVTLFGQPTSYWLHPETVIEGDQMFRIFMLRGWAASVLFELFYLAVAFLLVSVLNATPALICLFAYLFGHFYGASTWFFFHWKLGMEAPVAYGILLSAILVLTVLSQSKERRAGLP